LLNWDSLLERHQPNIDNAMKRLHAHRGLISATAIIVALFSQVALYATDAPANPSFSTTSGDIIKDHDFGVYKLGAPGITFNFDVYNLPAASGTTSKMTLQDATPFGDSTAMSLQGTINGLSPSAHAPLQLVLTTNQRGRLAVSYTLNFTSDSVPTAPLGHLAVAGHAIVSPPGDYDSDGDVDSTDYGIWRSHYGSTFAAADGNENGTVDAADYIIWVKNFSGPLGAGSADLSASTSVPEPAAAILGLLGATFLCVRSRIRECRVGKTPRALD
jgi:hypothetical protein